MTTPLPHTEVRLAALPECQIHLDGTLAAYDGKTKGGPWAFMCQECFDVHGTGLGLGVGQRLVLIESEPAPP